MSLSSYSTYKDSGVSWLGHVPTHWEIKRLKYLCDVQTGDKDTVEALEGGEYPFFVRSQTVEKINSYTFDCEAVLTAGDGVGVGKVFHHVNGKFDFHQRVYMMNNFRFISGRFFFNFLATMFHKVALEGGAKSTVDSLRMPLFLNFPLAIPPTNEQGAIVAFLGRETAKIDTLIAEQEKLIKLLAEKRQATISNVVTKGLNPNALMKDSGVEWLGTVPEHWAVTRIGAIFTEVVEDGSDQLPLLSVSIHDGVSDKELCDNEMDRKVTRSDDRSKYKAVQPHDLVYNMMRAWQGGFGSVAIHGMVSPAYVVARPTRALLTPFVEQVLRTQNAIVEMKRYSRGITDFRLRLYWDEFKIMQVAIPSLEEQSSIMALVAEETKRIDALVAEATRGICLLKERSSALISAAVTGKIDVRQVVQQEQTMQKAA